MVETYPRPRFGEPRAPKTPVNPGNRLVRAIDVVTVSHPRAAAFLVVCALLFFLPGFFTIPPVDRAEADRAVTTLAELFSPARWRGAGPRAARCSTRASHRTRRRGRA